MRLTAMLSPAEFVARNLADPIRVFIKGELHSTEKIEKGRFRLIASVSLIDQLVERLLYADQNEAEIAAWSRIPSKPGLGLDDKGLEQLRRNIDAMGEPWATDMRGYDWSVPAWLLELEGKARIKLAGAASNGRYARAVMSRVQALCYSVIVLSDGSMYSQTKPGIQKSGSYNTSAGNSRKRAMLAWLAAYRATGKYRVVRVMTAGDDCVEDISGVNIGSLMLAYQRMGFHLKLQDRSIIDFCSVVFNSDGSYSRPRWPKIVATLFTKAPADDRAREILLASLRDDLRHEPELLARVLDVVSQVGWGLAK